MKPNSIQTIVLIGAGNVAFHMVEAFRGTGRKIVQVYSRTEESARTFALKTGIDYTNNLNHINKDADLYIISVTDTALPLIAQEFKIKRKLVVHTSGFHPMETIISVSENVGVFYPLMTFTKNKPLDFLTIPLCIEANSNYNLRLLEDLALSFTSDIRYVTSLQRKKIHLAAVFACNFTNHFYQIAEEILDSCELPFDILKPLIKETADKVIKIAPHDAQTGPARRNDLEVIKQHLRMLDDKYVKEVYLKISEMIRTKYI